MAPFRSRLLEKDSAIQVSISWSTLETGWHPYVVPTWQICLRRIERFRRFRVFLPQEVRSFAEGVAVILDAYLSGELTYTVLTARR